MKALLALLAALVLVTGCTTLPGYQGGPAPRSTQYTYPGRAWNPDSGMAHSPVAAPAEPPDGGVFAFGLVFHDGTTGTSQERFDDFATCETGRTAYVGLTAQRVTDGGATVMTTKCFRSHDTSGHQLR